MESINKYMRDDRFIKLYPLCLIGSGMINLVLSFLGAGIIWESEKLVSIITGLFYIAIWLFFSFQYILTYKFVSKRINYMLIFLIISIVPYVIAFIRFSFDEYTFNITLQFFLFCVPCFCAAICLVAQNKVKEFINAFWVYNLALIPFQIIYIIRFCLGNEVDNLKRNFGLLNYMGIAYLVATLFIFVSINLFVTKRIKQRIAAWIVLILDWLTIIYSGTRGAIICCLFFTICIGIYKLFINKDNYKFSPLKLLMILICIYCFSIFVWSPLSAATNWRLDNFIHETNGTNVTIDEEAGEFKENVFEYIVSSDSKMADSIENIKEEILNDEEIENKNKFIEILDNDILNSRIDIYRLALMEYSKSPIIGNGPLSFSEKYEGYPHNIALEILTDFGTVGIVLFLVAIFLILRNIWIVILKDKYVASICIFAFTIAVKYMVSGTIYMSMDLMFVFSFAIMLCISKNQFINEENVGKK